MVFLKKSIKTYILIILKKSILLILLFSFSIFSQEEKKIDSLHQLYIQNQYNDLEKAYQCAKGAVLLSSKYNNDSLALYSSYYLTAVLLKQRKIKEALKSSLKTKFLAEKLNNQEYLGLAKLYTSIIYRRLGNFNKSLKNLEEALSIAEKNNYLNLKHEILNSKAFLLKNTKNNKKARNLLKSLINNKTYTNTYNIAETYNSLGSLYFKAIKDKDSSAYFYKKGIALIKNTKNNYLKTTLYLNYGDLLLQTNKKKEALNYLQQAEKLANKSYDYASLFFVNGSLGVYYDDNEQYPKAIEKYKKALNKYGKYANGNQKAHLYWLLSGAMYFNQQFKEGFEYQDELINLKDSLFTIEKNKTFEKLQTEYEVEKKNTQIQLLEKEKELESNRKKLIYGLGGFLVFILGLLVFVYRYKNKSQKLIQKQEQKLHQQEKEQLQQTQKLQRIAGFMQGEEKEKNRIALELHDGIGGKLAGIKHFVSALPKTVKTAALDKNITEITKEVRLLSHSLSYSLQKPLNYLLKELKEQYQNHFTIEVVLYPENEINNINNDKKLFIYRTIQELVNNACKYAKAGNLTISLTLADEVSLIVEDDGVGFDIEKPRNGIGLQNIQEKLVKFNGTLHIDTAIHRGTTILINIPK